MPAFSYQTSNEHTKTTNARSANKSIPPYADYGTEMCWIQDPDGNDLELMLPLPIDKLRQAFASGEPYRPEN